MNLEKYLCSIEKAFSIKLNIVDDHGSFYNVINRKLIIRRRMNHQCKDICRIGFDAKKCPAHCRFAMNETSRIHTEPFAEICWKKVVEIVVPLHDEDQHYGMLYAGSWRLPELEPPAGLTSGFYELYAKLPVLQNGKTQELKNLLELCAGGVLQMLKAENALQIPAGGTVEKIQRFIRSNAPDPQCTLPALAAFLGLSVSRTSHLLSQRLHRTFPRLLREERLNRAKILLSTSALSVKQIAESTGFGDEYYFNRVFKNHFKLSPGRYRKNPQGG